MTSGGEVVQWLKSREVVKRLTSSDAPDVVQRLRSAVATWQQPRSGPNRHMVGHTAGELTQAARDAGRRVMDEALQAALERNGFDDRPGL